MGSRDGPLEAGRSKLRRASCDVATKQMERGVTRCDSQHKTWQWHNRNWRNPVKKGVKKKLSILLLKWVCQRTSSDWRQSLSPRGRVPLCLCVYLGGLCVSRKKWTRSNEVFASVYRHNGRRMSWQRVVQEQLSPSLSLSSQVSPCQTICAGKVEVGLWCSKLPIGLYMTRQEQRASPHMLQGPCSSSLI